MERYYRLRVATSTQAIRRASEIIQSATGKPVSYYATSSRKSEFVAYRMLFVYLAVTLGATRTAAGGAINRSHATATHAYQSYALYATSWEPLVMLREKVIRTQKVDIDLSSSTKQ